MYTDKKKIIAQTNNAKHPYPQPPPPPLQNKRHFQAYRQNQTSIDVKKTRIFRKEAQQRTELNHSLQGSL